ncbi:MAG TPA: hypothetical protein PLG22_07185 [Kiritimatiellia bacterium]|nr:hypothetical protein [Kiritimatiellia bacterium]
MRVCDLMDILRKRYEPFAREHGMGFQTAPDPQRPYTLILAGGGGLCVLCYEGQARLDDTPNGRVPVGSRFALFVSASTALDADKAGGGGLFRQNASAAKKPLYEICEDFECDIKEFTIPDNDGFAEPKPYYTGTEPAVMPDGFVLNAYKIAFQIRRAMA